MGLKGTVQTKLLELVEEGSIWLQLEAIKDTKEHQLWHQIVKEVLVQWKDTSPKYATWEPTSILQQFLHLHP